MARFQKMTKLHDFEFENFHSKFAKGCELNSKISQIRSKFGFL